MNCRNTTTASLRRTWGWLKAVLLGAAMALCGHLEAQIGSYAFTTSSSSFAALTGATTVTLSSGDDGISGNIALPFAFNFGGTNMTNFQINSNGWLGLNTGTSSTTTGNYSALSSTVNNVIAAYNRDLTGGTGDFSWVVTGSAPNRILQIQWSNRASFTSTAVPASAQFQVWLYETTNVVEIRYGTVSNGTRTGAVTVQVGLRGASTATTNVRSLSSTTGWTAPTASNSSTATMSISTTLQPASGRVFTFTPPVVCTSLPSLTGGTASATVTSGCGSVASSTLSVTGATGGATGLTFQWRSGPVGGPYNTLLGTGATQVVSSVTSTTAFVRDIICTGGPATATSSEVVITVNPAVTPGVSASPAGPFCGAANTTLTATGGLTYAWAPATGLDATTGATVNCTTTSTRTYTVTATGVGGCTGTANVTVTVNPAPLVISTTATPNPVCNGGNSNLNVTVGGTSTVIGSGLTVNDGNAAPYPSTIAVSGIAGTIIDLRVNITNFSHTWPNDVDMVLFGPTGAHSVIFTDAIGGSGGVTGRNYTFASGASALPTTDRKSVV